MRVSRLATTALRGPLLFLRSVATSRRPKNYAIRLPMACIRVFLFSIGSEVSWTPNPLISAWVRLAHAVTSSSPRSTGQVYGCLGCSAQCGRCARTIRKIMDEALGAAGCPAHPVFPARWARFRAPHGDGCARGRRQCDRKVAVAAE